MSAARVNALLAALGLEPLGAPRPVVGGWGDARLWQIETESGLSVLRVYRSDDEPVARREARVLDQLGSRGFPVARVVASGNTAESALLLLGWLPGHGLDVELLESGDARSLGRQFGQLQARLHAVDPPDGIPHATSWPAADVYPDRLLEGLANVSARRDRLLHLDFHPANVLIDGGEVSGLIDWTNVGHGDPRFDIARTYLLLRYLPGLEPELKMRFRPLLRPFICSWHNAYRREMGAIRQFAPFLAWAGYGLLYDLARKPPDSISSGAARESRDVSAHLERNIEQWMASDDLDSDRG